MKRSAEYYRSKEGKEKKKSHNRRRSIQGVYGNGGEDLVQEKTPCQDTRIIKDKVTLSYIQMLVSLIEGRSVSMDEVLKMLYKIMRQHSFDKRRRFVYAFTYPDQKPP